MAVPYSRFSCTACKPTSAEKAVARWRRSRVFCGGMLSSRASVSEVKRGSRICGRSRFGDIQHEREGATPQERDEERKWDSYDETAVDAAPPQIRGELSKIHGSQPLHHAMVGPLHHL